MTSMGWAAGPFTIPRRKEAGAFGNSPENSTGDCLGVLMLVSNTDQ